MKYIICLLLAFIRWDAGHAQQIACAGNVIIISSDTNHYRVYSLSDEPKYHEDSIQVAIEPKLLAYLHSHKSLYSGQKMSTDSTLPWVKMLRRIVDEGGSYDIVDTAAFGKEISRQVSDFIAGAIKYDTIGPLWRLVSDTAAGHWNPASAMQVWEVRIYKNYAGEFNMKTKKPVSPYVLPEHFIWLDSNKKPLKLAVWPLNIER